MALCSSRLANRTLSGHQARSIAQGFRIGTPGFLLFLKSTYLTLKVRLRDNLNLCAPANGR